MKVYTKIVIDMKSGLIVSEHSFDYLGFVALCKGGGGGGAGAVDYPDYMEAVHKDWLEGDAASRLTAENVTAVMSTAIGGSPFTGEVAYDPETSLDSVDTAVTGFNTLIDTLSHEADWESAIDAVVAKIDAAVTSDDYIDADIAAYTDLIDDEYYDVVEPRFESGMRDINAVVSSAFVIGKSNLVAKKNRDVAKYSSELRLKMNIQRNALIVGSAGTVLDSLMRRVAFERDYASLITEAKRIRIVASKEQTDQDLLIAEADARWDLEVFQYGGNVLAAIGGGTVQPSMPGMSKGQSALSGAMAGAAMGANPALAGATGGWSIAIGAVIGGYIGYTS